jgi:hypothetical protein
MPFSARVKEGQIQFPSPGAAMRFQEWKRDHDGSHITIDEIKPERSTSQLRLYRSWLRALCAQTGNDEEALHNWLLKQCAPQIVVKIKGPKGELEDVQSKRTHGGDETTMTKDEFAEYLDKCSALTNFPLPTQEELIAMGYLPH